MKFSIKDFFKDFLPADLVKCTVKYDQYGILCQQNTQIQNIIKQCKNWPV